MNKTGVRCLLLALFMLAPSAVFSAENAGGKKQAMIGKLNGVSGKVEILKRGTAEWLQAQNGMTVATGDQITTDIDGKAVIEFENSKTEVKPLTQFAVGRAMESGNEYYTEIFLQAGNLSSAVNKLSGKQNKFTVTTPSAVAGIRGTVQDIGVYGDATEVEIHEGEGYVAPLEIEQLPAAVQEILGAGPAVEEGAPSTSEGAAASLDAWLEGSFDNQVEGVEKVEAPEEAAGGEEAGAAEAPEEAKPLDENALGEIVEVGDGQQAGIEGADNPEVTTPEEILRDGSTTDVLPDGATDAEAEAAEISTEVVDEPASLTEQDDIAEHFDEIIDDIDAAATAASETPPPFPP